MEKDAQNCKNWAVKKAGRKAAPPAEPATYRFTLETDAVCHALKLKKLFDNKGIISHEKKSFGFSDHAICICIIDQVKCVRW
jgi:hypothetical protein